MTRQDLINEVAFSKLRIAGTGQALEAEYQDEIDRKIDPLIMQLSADDICYVANLASIPSEWFDGIASLLANLCAPLAGKPFDPNAKDYHEKGLRRLTSTRPTYEPQSQDYF